MLHDSIRADLRQASTQESIMGNLEHKLHSPGVMIYRATGDLSEDDLEEWRDRITNFIKENEKRGACGVLIDIGSVDSLSVDALDGMMELLADPEDILRKVKMRFALIGVKPFTQRFLRETMPVDEIKHIRAKFFHEVSEAEALAWLQAMITSLEEPPAAKPVQTEIVEAKKVLPDQGAKKPAEAPDAKKPGVKAPETKGPDVKVEEKILSPKERLLALKGMRKQAHESEPEKAAPGEEK